VAVAKQIAARGLVLLPKAARTANVIVEPASPKTEPYTMRVRDRRS